MIKERYLHPYITSDLKEKMVFLGGARQIGKTTLAKLIGQKDYSEFAYLNWDSREDRKNIIEGRFPAEIKLLIFDEIHKYKLWKNYIKGIFDKNKEILNILVTGSARMDLYRHGGDSLMGRYHYYRLHPFSLRETLQLKPNINVLKELDFSFFPKHNLQIFKNLFHFGGFPEPFIKQEDRVLRRFHNEYIDRLIREDIRDVEQIRDLSSLQLLVEILPGKIGSLFSVHSLQEDLHAAHKTVSLWVDILERFYYLYRIFPYASTLIKSLRKQPKVYLWDWSQIEDKNARLENMVASGLLKMVHFLYDMEGYKAELCFLRDIEGREVDFLVTVDKKPWFAVEVKNTDKTVSSNMKYFGTKLNIPFQYQVIGESGIDFMQNNVRVISADKFLSGLV